MRAQPITEEMPRGIWQLAKAVEESPESAVANWDYLRAWLRFGSQTDSKLALRGGIRRVRDSEWAAAADLMRLNHLSLIDEAIARHDDIWAFGTPEASMLVQLKLLGGRSISPEELGAADEPQAVLAHALYALKREGTIQAYEDALLDFVEEDALFADDVFRGFCLAAPDFAARVANTGTTRNPDYFQGYYLKAVLAAYGKDWDQVGGYLSDVWRLCARHAGAARLAIYLPRGRWNPFHSAKGILRDVQVILSGDWPDPNLSTLGRGTHPS